MRSVLRLQTPRAIFIVALYFDARYIVVYAEPFTWGNARAIFGMGDSGRLSGSFLMTTLIDC